MAKSVHNDVLDGALNVIKNNVIKVTVCSTEPTTYGQATTAGANMLAEVAVTGTDFTIADDTSGRKVTFGGKSNIVIGTSGTAGHIALCDGSKLLYVTTCTSQALTANGANTVSIPAFKISIADPS